MPMLSTRAWWIPSTIACFCSGVVPRLTALLMNGMWFSKGEGWTLRLQSDLRDQSQPRDPERVERDLPIADIACLAIDGHAEQIADQRDRRGADEDGPERRVE